MKKLAFFIPIIVFYCLSAQVDVYAIEDSENEHFEKIEYAQIDRVEILQKFFRKYNSPLETSAETFVEVADKYGLDYRWLPAIAGVESTFAKFYIRENYNPFGWGGGLIKFESFDEAIERVGKGLHDGYLAKGADTIDRIAPIYNPPYPQNWSKNVNYFVNQISEI